MRIGCWLGVVAALTAGGCGKPKGEAEKTPESAGAVAASLPAGWYATYTGAGGVERSAFVASPAFALGEGESIHPGVPAGAFEAAFSASITVDEPGKYRFGADVAGVTVTVTLFDALGVERASVKGAGGSTATTAWAVLMPATYTLSYRVKAGPGDARLRPTWEMERTPGGGGFRAEPIPAGVIRVASFVAADAGRAAEAFRGRVMLGELGCNHCHADTSGHVHGSAEDHPAAVLTRRPPLLGEIGQRASPAWLARWVADPQAIKPGSGMPGLFGGGSTGGEVDAIVHYLVSLGGPVAFEATATESGVLARGRELYHTAGCIACHGALEAPGAVFEGTMLSAEMPAGAVRHPFGDLKGKWRAPALSAFLLEPARTHPGGRMPSMTLTKEESDLIATYLVAHFGTSAVDPDAFEIDAAKVDQGRAAFGARGCASCHEIGHAQAEVVGTRVGKPLAELTSGKGCLDPADVGTPRYSLTPEDRRAIGLALAEIAAGMGHGAPIDHARLTIEALNCRGCHTIDGEGGPAEGLGSYFRTLDEVELGDEGRLPPNLSNVGWKLQTGWLRSVLLEAGRARPYMAARMPQFGEAAVGGLAHGLGEIAGVFPNTDTQEPEASDDEVLAGLKLSGAQGLNCISCHVFGDLPPAGTPGPAMTSFAERLRHEWYSTYMHAPQRFKPGTRMTAFFATESSPITDVLGGDPDRQIGALWAYFNLGDFMPPPEGLDLGDPVVLPVGTRPRVFRTFLKSAGSRGIAVGYPLGLHFAFDGEGARLVEAWRGGFVDASGAWKGRGGTISEVKGGEAWRAPLGPSLIVSPARPGAWPVSAEGVSFGGYRLRGERAPVFVWSLGEVRVEEVFEPSDSGAAIRRAFTVSNVPPGSVVWFNAGDDVESHKVLENVFEVKHEGGVIGHVPASDGQPIAFEVIIRPE